jgi:hypothetical protein
LAVCGTLSYSKWDYIILKNDAILRQFFYDNAASIINKLQKKSEDSLK